MRAEQVKEFELQSFKCGICDTIKKRQVSGGHFIGYLNNVFATYDKV